MRDGRHVPGTLAEFVEEAARRYGERPALRFRSPGGDWKEVGYDGLRETVRSVGRGLVALGVRPDDRVAILAETRPEWTYAHFAVLAAGAVVVPVYPTAGEDELAWVLGDSASTVVICEDTTQAGRVEALRAKLPGLRHVVRIAGDGGEGAVGGRAAGPGAGAGAGAESGAGPASGSVSGSGPESGPASGAGSGTRAAALPGTGPGAGGDGGVPPLLGALPQAPLAELLARSAARTGDDLCAIVYTSGTTGLPKGCRLTHGNFAAVQDATADLIEGGPGDTTYLYLPLAHLLAQLIQLTSLGQGGTLCYFGGRIENVVAELAEVRPTHLPSVPRLFEKVHATVASLAESRGAGGRDRFESAVRTGVEVAELRARGEEPTGPLRAAWQAADESLFSLVRAAFGGRLRWALTGGAPIAPQTMDFLRACGIRVFEGYGMTESAGVISLNHPGAVRYGTVGRPVPGCEVRIAADGEVFARGPGVFPGYHADPAATEQALDPDGWLRTGDLGSLDADGFLRITGRKKDLIITSGGKNLTPSLVEAAIQQSRWISRAVMIGDARPYPVALITLDAEEIAAWARSEGLDPGRGYAGHPVVRARCQEAVDAANAQVARPARIRAFTILDEDFTVGGGELTPTLKLRRSAIVNRYAAEIDALYER
ncbi:AMP-dependent synthetase/ligase [Streptomyces syringium]|uniref:AMP-dependent synthetase/ligase n=1 Tax=Streptomyces syringium TaxID=76729 RepID=UPI00342699EB